MADTGEDRELKQRVNAHQSRVVNESRKLAEKTRKPSRKTGPKGSAGRSPSSKSRG